MPPHERTRTRTLRGGTSDPVAACCRGGDDRHRRSSGTTSSSTAPSPAWSSPGCTSRTRIRWSARCRRSAIYAVGFVARPIGAAIFGHYGDRIGRKSALIATLLLMGIATFLVALVPTYDTHRDLGRGHPDGAALHPGHRRRRRVGRLGAARRWNGRDRPASRLHRVVAAVRRAVRAVPRQPGRARRSALCPAMQFLVWGWRIPFLLSIVLVGDRPLHPTRHPRDAGVRAPGRRKAASSAAPMVEVIRRQPKEILLTALCRMGEQAPFYIFTAFVFAYGTGTLKIGARLSADRGADCVACCRSSPSRSPATCPTGSAASACTCWARSRPACTASSISRCSTPACRP